MYIIVYNVGMNSIQYTIRNIPDSVDRILREQARKKGKSFNQTVVGALKQATGTSSKPAIHHDLDWFIGAGETNKQEYEAQKWLDNLPSEMDK